MAVLTRNLEQALHRALACASGRDHEYATLEHLLLALTEEPDAMAVLAGCGVDISRLRSRLEKFIDEELKMLVVGGAECTPTPGFQRVLQRSIVHIQSSGQWEVTGGNVIVAILSERESHAASLLLEEEITRFDAVNFLSHGIMKGGSSEDFRIRNSSEACPEDEEHSAGRPSSASSALDKYCVDLNRRALRGEIDILVGRETEIRATIQTLCRRRKNNPILVGEPGVGKTAIAEGLALRIVRGDVPEVIGSAQMYSLDVGSLLAGTRFRGDFEERVKAVVAEMAEDRNRILFIDEIHTLVGVGATSGGALDASNLLKPALQDGRLRCIGSTTHQEYRQYFEKDRAFARRFQRVEVTEPSMAEAVQILKGLVPELERFHRVRYSAEAIKAAVELSARHIHDRALPDKAIDVIDETGAARQAHSSDRNSRRVSVREIEQAVAKMAKVPRRSLTHDDARLLKGLEENLLRLVFGQDHAIARVVQAVKLSRSGLREPGKPVGSFLFAGPTGVGKTELAKNLASCLGIELLRFDMSEYLERHSVSRLIGAPPGYVGFDQGGLLTSAVEKTPHAVLLLDEIEKAHSDVFNLLLQVMDHGKLTDTAGKSVNFQNIILVMTTNVGADTYSRGPMGFGRTSREGEEAGDALKQVFSPEFRNRLDATLNFSQLQPEHVAKIAEKFILETEQRLSERNISLSLSGEARRWLALRGYDEENGARPLARVVDEHIRRPLAEEILFGQLKSGGSVHIDLNSDEKTFRFTIQPRRRKSIPAKNTSAARTPEMAS